MQTENVDTQQPLQEEQTSPVATLEEQAEAVALQEEQTETIATQEDQAVEDIQAEETTPVITEEPVSPPPETKTPLYKKPLFWVLTIALATFVCVLAYILLALGAARDPQSTTEHTTETQPSVTTEATLPPPEANPIGLGDFYMDGDYLSCLTTTSVLGIDVSWWQKDIDWEQVKAAGVDFAMIRAGWRGSEQGVLAEDTYAQANYQGATAVGIKVGAYFFSQAISVEEAEEEARYLLDIIKDWNVEMPVVFDWEYIDDESRTANMDARTLTDCTKAFCEVVRGAGYQPMVYFNANHSYDRIYIRELTDYPFWLARYDTVLDYPYKVDIWQYTETGSVPGISGNVDINLFFPWE